MVHKGVFKYPRFNDPSFRASAFLVLLPYTLNGSGIYISGVFIREWGGASLDPPPGRGDAEPLKAHVDESAGTTIPSTEKDWGCVEPRYVPDVRGKMLGIKS